MTAHFTGISVVNLKYPVEFKGAFPVEYQWSLHRIGIVAITGAGYRLVY